MITVHGPHRLDEIRCSAVMYSAVKFCALYSGWLNQWYRLAFVTVIEMTLNRILIVLLVLLYFFKTLTVKQIWKNVPTYANLCKQCWRKQNPAYGRQRISRPMRIVALPPRSFSAFFLPPWPDGQWEALKKVTSKEDKQIYKLTSRL